MEFCDLHDKAGRMEKVGAIREALSWRTSRAYLHWRIRRRLQETAVSKKLRAAVSFSLLVSILLLVHNCFDFRDRKQPLYIAAAERRALFLGRSRICMQSHVTSHGPNRRIRVLRRLVWDCFRAALSPDH